MVAGTFYLDASALVKLVVPAPESVALVAYLAERPLQATCAISRVETARAVRRAGYDATPRLDDVFDHLVLLPLDLPAIERAATLEPPILRTLDAIHVATALSLVPDLVAMVTYDTRLVEAAAANGIATDQPR